MKKDSGIKIETQRKTDFYPGPFSNRHKYKYRKMLVTFCSGNKINTINAAQDQLFLAGIKADEPFLNEIFDNKLFLRDYYILPIFMPKKGIRSYLEALLCIDEVVLFENEKKFINKIFLDACFIFNIPIKFISKDPICNAYRIVEHNEIKIEKDVSRINELVQDLANQDYSWYPKIEIDVDYGSSAFWIKGANLTSNVPYVGIPQLLYRRIYEWAKAYWCFIEEQCDDTFIDNYYKESEWIFNELKSRIGEHVKITLSENF